MNKQLIVIVGPTASGKTSLSIELAKLIKTEIISCDSRQFYKELLIGTSPPSDNDLQKIKHHFIKHISIQKDYNVGEFEKDAIRKIEKLFKKYNQLIMVGGSGLYANVICNGIDEIPPSSLEVRSLIIKKYEQKGLGWLQDQVNLCDPKFFQNCDQNNPNRLIRALEVFQLAEKPFSDFRIKKIKERSFSILKIGLACKRSVLYERINSRVDEMIQKGLVEEVKGLREFRNKNSLQTIGYKELFEYFEGHYTLKEAINKIKINTRRFAKRQITWFKKDLEINWFLNEDTEEIKKFIGL